MRKPRVLLVSQNSHVTGGSDMVFLQEIALLEQAGHEVMAFCAWNEDATDLQARFGAYFPRGAEFASPSPKDYFRYLYNGEAHRKMADAVRAFRPDICHMHIYYGKITASILKPLREAGVPSIQTLHEYRHVCPVSVPFVNGAVCTKCSSRYYLPVLLHRCNRGSLARSALSMLEMHVSDFLGAKDLARYICVSERQREHLVGKGLPADRSSVVYNSIDETFHDRAAPRDIDVLYVGRIETYKGIDILIELARRLAGRSFLAAGHGAYLDDARRMSADLPNIEFTGQVGKGEVADLMRRSRALVVPSQWEETFGLISAEAMACGTPVVASRIGGIPEVVAAGVTGFVIDPSNVDGFQHGIERLLDDAALWRAFSEAGKDRVEKHFSRGAHLSALVDTYERVIGEHSRQQDRYAS